MKQKTIKLLILTVFSIISLSFSVFAADGLIYFTDPEVEAGSNVEVEMTVQCDTDKVGDVNVLLKYPSEDLVFIDGTSASGGAGTIRVHGRGTNTENGKYVFALNFATKNQGEYSVTIDSEEVYTETGSPITITHKGSSKVTVTASTTINKDVMLSSLEISPGTLVPNFDPAIANYSITVGLSVDRLTINANAADSGSKVSVENNENLKEGENDVVIYVRSADDTKQSEYHISVLKTEGGEENVASESESVTDTDISTGVQLSCKGKTIMIMDPTVDTQVPEGFRESKIKIDGQPVTGWITGDSENPEYFLVYGMNDDGEINFYRYDRKEKTIQRYFNDNKSVNVMDSEEYITLNQLYEDAKKKSDTRTMFMYIIGIISLLLVGMLVYFGIRLRNVSNELENIKESSNRRNKERSLDPEKSKRSRHSLRQDNNSDATTVIRHSTTELFTKPIDSVDENEEKDEPDSRDDIETNPVTDETKVLGTRERRRSTRRSNGISDETTVIRRESRRQRQDRDI